MSKGNETISLQEWVEAIQDVASLEKEFRETSNLQKQQLLYRARQAAVERVLAMRYLTGSTTDRIEEILDTEPWAAAFYNELSEETPHDLERPHSQAGARLREREEPAPDPGGLPSWYSGASPFGKAPKKPQP
jgi:hypothetical protein